MMRKPDVDHIEGLSPAISIEQKTSRNPRSTVATVTEIYDHTRLLWARVGSPSRAAKPRRLSALFLPSLSPTPTVRVTGRGWK